MGFAKNAENPSKRILGRSSAESETQQSKNPTEFGGIPGSLGRGNWRASFGIARDSGFAYGGGMQMSFAHANERLGTAADWSGSTSFGHSSAQADASM